jgi:succinate dehydrogenase/fumarate reductase cytochrome b subunit
LFSNRTRVSVTISEAKKGSSVLLDVFFFSFFSACAFNPAIHHALAGIFVAAIRLRVTKSPNTSVRLGPKRPVRSAKVVHVYITKAPNDKQSLSRSNYWP